MSNNSSSNTGGIGFVGLLTILFIGLKLTGYIDWSWWWVLAPIWIGILMIILFVLLFFIVPLIVAGILKIVIMLKRKK